MGIKKEIFDLDIIVPHMQTHWPSNRCDHKKIAIDYYNEVFKEVILGQTRQTAEQQKLKLLPIIFKKIRHATARYGVKGNQQYWFDWFQEHYPLMIKVTQGYSLGKKKELTMIKFTRELEIMIADQDAKTILNTVYSDFADKDIDFVDVDLKSLTNYINHTRDALAKMPKTDNRVKVMEEGLKQAELVKLIAEVADNQLPQIINISAFGRKYYRGPNLQSFRKMVRQAALGDCWQYDIEASVYAWKLDTAKDIDPTIKLPATIDYLQFKNKKRQHLAQLVFGNTYEQSIKTIKQVITAVGFGARTTNNVWRLENGQWKTSSIKELIYSNELIARLFNDPWFKEFIKEQDLITKLIFNEVRECDVIKNNELLKSDRGLISKNKTISFLYQQTEAKIIRALNVVLEDHGQQMLLLCHDGFYTKHRAPVQELRSKLKEFLPSANLEEEHCNKFLYNAEQNQLELDHKQWIKQEEQIVAQAYNKHVHRPTKLIYPKITREDDFFEATNGYDQAYAIPEELISQLEFEALFNK